MIFCGLDRFADFHFFNLMGLNFLNNSLPIFFLVNEFIQVILFLLSPGSLVMVNSCIYIFAEKIFVFFYLFFDFTECFLEGFKSDTFKHRIRYFLYFLYLIFHHYSHNLFSFHIKDFFKKFSFFFHKYIQICFLFKHLCLFQF